MAATIRSRERWKYSICLLFQISLRTGFFLNLKFQDLPKKNLSIIFLMKNILQRRMKEKEP